MNWWISTDRFGFDSWGFQKSRMIPLRVASFGTGEEQISSQWTCISLWLKSSPGIFIYIYIYIMVYQSSVPRQKFQNGYVTHWTHPCIRHIDDPKGLHLYHISFNWTHSPPFKSFFVISDGLSSIQLELEEIRLTAAYQLIPLVVLSHVYPM